MDSRTVTITLQVEVDGDDVRGSARAALAVSSDRDAGVGPATGAGVGPAADDPRVFTGWLGLIGAIDALLGFPADSGAAARALATTTAQEGAQTR
jgi:hypothetical protein